MAEIHATAVIADGAQIADDVKIGPYCIVGADVKLGKGVELKSHVVIDGDTVIGEDTVIYPFASIGAPTQDKKYKEGDPAKLIIGNNNTIREHVTMNPGHTEPEKITRVGNNCLFMVGSHVAHDCQVGDYVIMANNATLAGHVVVGDHAVLGGLSAVHQFVRIGPYAMIGGMSGVEHDVIPYGSVMGDRAKLSGLNIIGLKRHGFTREQIHAARQAYKQLFSQQLGTMGERVNNVNTSEQLVADIIHFIKEESSRGICKPAAENQNQEIMAHGNKETA